MNGPFRRRFRLFRHEEILFLVGGNSRLSKKGKKYGHPSPLWARISAMSSNTVSGLAAVQKSLWRPRPRTSAHAQAAAPTT